MLDKFDQVLDESCLKAEAFQYPSLADIHQHIEARRALHSLNSFRSPSLLLNDPSIDRISFDGLERFRRVVQGGLGRRLHFEPYQEGQADGLRGETEASLPKGTSSGHCN